MSNLAQRVAVGVVGIPLVLLLCMAGGLYFFTFIAVASAVALRELYGLTRAKGAQPLAIVGLAGGFFVNLSFYRSPVSPDLSVVLIAIVIASSLWALFRGRGSALLDLSTTLFGVLYVSLFFGTLIGIRELWNGYLVISIFATIWICDSAAFHVGVAWGKHKLLPRVSPQKSWEGAIAGLMGAFAAALAAKYLVLDFLPVSGALVLGAIVGTIGQLGDLVESLMKRDAGVKDSSALLPGHGGAFDRFDSVLLVAPCVYLYLKHFAV